MRHIRPALVLLAWFVLVTGFGYTSLLTGIVQVFFPHEANGSLLYEGDRVTGSALIGQSFEAPGYFWGRLSATVDFPYNAAASGGSNLGPLNPALSAAVQARIEALRLADPGNKDLIPVDLVTSSASGLDPDISVAAAYYQIPRVARERGMSAEALRRLVDEHVTERQLGFLGEARINVLGLNLALDEYWQIIPGEH